MQAEDIIIELKKLSKNKEITKNELMITLKEYARLISVHDLMIATARMRKDGEYVQSQYREKYLKIYIKYFIMRMKEILENNTQYTTFINKTSFDTSFPMLERTFEKEKLESYTENDKFPLIYVLTALYTTFILEEPIHPVGSDFPGNLEVEEKMVCFYVL